MYINQPRDYFRSFSKSILVKEKAASDGKFLIAVNPCI